MPRQSMTFTVDLGEDEAREIAQELAEQLDASSWAVAIIDQPYTVAGVVKGKPSQRWSAQVFAQSRAEAEQKAVEESDQPRTVAVVLDGHQEV